MLCVSPRSRRLSTRGADGAFYQRIYHGHSLRLTLAFSGWQKSEVCEVDSKHGEDYALLHCFAAVMLAWRRQKLQERFRDGREVEFPLLDASGSLRIVGKDDEQCGRWS